MSWPVVFYCIFRNDGRAVAKMHGNWDLEDCHYAHNHTTYGLSINKILASTFGLTFRGAQGLQGEVLLPACSTPSETLPCLICCIRLQSLEPRLFI